MADLTWDADGPRWPLHEHSRFVQSGGLRWHVQLLPGPTPTQAPGAPCVLLLHGTGASTHSWRDVAPLLAQHAQVISLDLPGHAFTGMPPGGVGSPQLTLPGMARAVHGLLQTLQLSPTLVVGHSAGAAIAVRMCLDGLIHPRRIIGLNAALLPLGGLAGRLFSPAAKLLAAAPLVPRLFAWHATEPAVLQRLLHSTGSTLDATGTALYQRLVRSPAHAAGALGMMANWDLPTLSRHLPQLAVPLDLMVGTRDRTVPPEQALRVLELLVPAARGEFVQLEGLGHLAHEERPERVAGLITQHLMH
jgi:magnesium chelatase accessory protein